MASDIASLPVSKDPKVAKCGWCDGQEATTFCSSCVKFSCDGCQRGHKKAKASESHAFVSVEEGFKVVIQQPQEGDGSASDPPRSHQGEGDKEEKKALVRPVFRRDLAEIKPDQEPVLMFGSRGMDDGEFKSPVAVINSRDEIVVCDQSNCRIQILDLEGNLLRKFGEKGEGEGQFKEPSSISIDERNDEIIVADEKTHRVQVFSSQGDFLRSFGSPGKGDGQFDRPFGAIVDPLTGNYIVADFGNSRIQVFDAAGRFLTKFGPSEGEGQLEHPFGLAFLSNHNLVVGEYSNNKLVIFDPEFNFVKAFAEGCVNEPWQLFVDSDDNIFVADHANNRVAVFSAETEELVAEFDTEEFVGAPTSITMDRSNRIIVSGIKDHIGIY